jgi:hypothetical protein
MQSQERQREGGNKGLKISDKAKPYVIAPHDRIVLAAKGRTQGHSAAEP